MTKFSAYPHLDGLFDLACRNGVDIRPTLLRVLTDLYAQKPSHSAEEEAQYAELAQRLIETVDDATRAAVAARLAGYPGAPAAIMRQLAELTSSAAVPTAPAPPAPDPPKPEAELLELFLTANASERRLILTNLDPMPAEARAVQPASLDMIMRLENAALAHNSGEFTRLLERALTINRALVERLVDDASGEPIVVAARALRMKPDALQRILLFLNPAIGQSVERVYDLARLYDEITPAAAERMVSIWRSAGSKRRAAHQPLHWDDERREARALPTPARRRLVSERKELPGRQRNSAR